MNKLQYCQMQIEDNGKCKNQCEHCKEYYKDLELLKHKEFIIKLQNQLTEWIDGCRFQANLFHLDKMDVSELNSTAMAQAYDNVKQFLNNNYEKTT